MECRTRSPGIRSSVRRNSNPQDTFASSGAAYRRNRPVPKGERTMSTTHEGADHLGLRELPRARPARSASAARSAGRPATDAGRGQRGGRRARAAGRRSRGSAARRRAARPSGPTGAGPSSSAGAVVGAGVLERQAEHEQLVAGGEVAARRRGDRRPVLGRQVRARAAAGACAPPRRSARRRRRRRTRQAIAKASRAGSVRGDGPLAGGGGDVAEHVVDPRAAGGPLVERGPQPRRPAAVRSSAGQTASRSVAWWCSRTRPISSACRASVGGALGVVGRRPGGQLGQQPQLAADQLVQHALVGDGAAGPSRSCGAAAVGRRPPRAGRGSGRWWSGPR